MASPTSSREQLDGQNRTLDTIRAQVVVVDVRVDQGRHRRRHQKRGAQQEGSAMRHLALQRAPGESVSGVERERRR